MALRGFGNLEHRSLTEQKKITSQEKGVKFQQNEAHLLEGLWEVYQMQKGLSFDVLKFGSKPLNLCHEMP